MDLKLYKIEPYYSFILGGGDCFATSLYEAMEWLKINHCDIENLEELEQRLNNGEVVAIGDYWARIEA